MKDRSAQTGQAPTTGAPTTGVSRRRFLTQSSSAAVAGALINLIWLDDAIAAIPASEGYLLVDTKKCQGCVSCMLACSLVHEGTESLSLARIQVLQNPFEKFPADVTVEQCRQCVAPQCAERCPTDAITANDQFGNVRMVDKTKCIGCCICLDACPHTPSRPLVASDSKFGGQAKGRKCDLCAAAPFHWDARGGGPQGTQACVEVCPMRAIQFTARIPNQAGDEGYKVDLRDDNWEALGFPRD